MVPSKGDAWCRQHLTSPGSFTSVACGSPGRGRRGSVGSCWGLIGSTAATYWIVRLTRVVAIPKLLDPLQELEVVLHFALHETVGWNRLNHDFVAEEWERQ
jgi:hypothetical protein